MATNPFLEWLPEVAADDIVIGGNESGENMWSFSLTPEQAAALVPEQVETFVRDVLAARSQKLAATARGPMLFYCWHDEMAAQLRFSLVSKGDGGLPFGCEVERVESLSEIVRPFLSSRYHGGIPWSEFRDISDLSESELEQLDQQDQKYTLKVWAQECPL